MKRKPSEEVARLARRQSDLLALHLDFQPSQQADQHTVRVARPASGPTCLTGD